MMRFKKILTLALGASVGMSSVVMPMAIYADDVQELDELADDDEATQELEELEDDDDGVTVDEDDKPYISLGEDLTSSQRATVLKLFGITESDLESFDVSYVTNSEEHEYLDGYISSDKIGTKSLSSVVVMQGESGDGIKVTTYNISYCTVGMYKNALATAGIEDAEVIVAAPFPISGTAALVGAIKAYEVMTGDDADDESVDAALNELVVTGELTEETGEDSDTIEGMIAYVKTSVVANDYTDEESIEGVIDDGCEQFGVSLTEKQKKKLVELMQKIGNLDLDADTLMEQAQSIYDKVASVVGEDTLNDIANYLQSDDNIFIRIWNAIVNFFKNLFGM